MNIKFEQAMAGDLKLILSFFKTASQSLKKKNVSQWSYWKNPPMDKIKWVEEGLKNNEFYFICKTSGQKTGMFRLLAEDVLYWGEQGKEKGVRYIHSLVVNPEFSGLGIGKIAMQKIIEDLKVRGIGKLRLDCDASNKLLCQYYTNLGFKKTGIKETRYSVNNLYEMSID